jgi:flavin reductase (DIM6/NTAB) family NADH-FMN oxidoreductase RutF
VAGFTAVESVRVSPPRIKESPIQFECVVHDIIHIGEPAAGGGALIIGEIVLFHVADHLYEGGRIDIDKLDPLGRLSGTDYTTLGKRISLPRERPERPGSK